MDNEKRESERESDGLRKAMKHNMSSLSISLPVTDLGFSVPKQTYLGAEKGAENTFLWRLSQKRPRQHLEGERELTCTAF